MVDKDQTRKKGRVKITEDVLRSIVAIKTLEINGVVGMGSDIMDGINDLFGSNSWIQGVKISQTDIKSIECDVNIIVKYGYRIPDLALRVQERVKSSIESLTDYKVHGVNIYVQDIYFDKTPGTSQ